MKKKKARFAPATANTLMTDLSAEEKARALSLADIALHNPARTPLPAGERAKREHRRLMEQLERAAEKTRRIKRAA